MDVDEMTVEGRSEERCLDTGKLKENVEEEDVDDDGSQDDEG